MKALKKFLTLFFVLAIGMTFCLALTACKDDKGDDPDIWDGKFYTVTVYLADGKTPAEGISFSLCYNMTSGSSSCLNAAKTDANGKVTFDTSKITNMDGNPVLHVNKSVISDTYEFPAGYSFPSNLTTITMVDEVVYEHAIALTDPYTTLTLTVA